MKYLLIFSVFYFVSASLCAQNSYEFFFSTNDDDQIMFVCQDVIDNEQILLYTRDCKYNDSSCVSARFIYKINTSGDTSRLPFIDQRNDTLFSINNIIREENGDYFMTGLAYLSDSNSFIWFESDYNVKWNSSYQIIWESINSRPSPYDTLSKSSNFKILKLINGNYLVGKTILTLETGVATRYYLTEVDAVDGSIIKSAIQDYSNGYLQGLTYNHDSSEILVHMSRTWMNECHRNSCGVFSLDTATYDTLSSYCYNRDDDDPQKYWCVHVPYNAKLKENGNLIISGTGDCTTLSDKEYYLFIYEYDTAFNLLNRAFYTDKDTLYDAGWYESMAFNEANEILLAGNHDRMQVPFSSYYNYIYLAKVNSDLQLITERYMGGDAEYVVLSMDATEDGGMVVSGTRYDYQVNDNEHDAFIFKTDGNLWVDIQENSTMEIHSALVYPNPGSNKLMLRTMEYPSTFELRDMHGNLLIKKQINNHISEISTEFLQNGIYLWNLIQNNYQIDNGKWLKK